MEGGPSHIDLFDPKPELTETHGKPLPPSFGKVFTPMGVGGNTLLASKRTFQQHGQSGTVGLGLVSATSRRSSTTSRSSARAGPTA